MKIIYKVFLIVIPFIVIIFFTMFYKSDIKIPASLEDIKSNQDFSGISDADKYHLVSTKEFSLTSSLSPNGEEPDASSFNLYFQADGAPIFLKSDPPSHGEIIKNNSNNVYALEIYTSEPDMSVVLWDLKNKNVYVVAQCGTACGFNGFYWISNSKFAVYGIEQGYGEGESFVAGSQFLNIYNLSDMTMSSYSDK